MCSFTAYGELDLFQVNIRDDGVRCCMCTSFCNGKGHELLLYLCGSRMEMEAEQTAINNIDTSS